MDMPTKFALRPLVEYALFGCRKKLQFMGKLQFSGVAISGLLSVHQKMDIKMLCVFNLLHMYDFQIGAFRNHVDINEGAL